MAREPCDGCGRSLKIAGGIANLWSFGGDRAEGLTLELRDGSEHFLCYDCIERLPDDSDPTAADVAALSHHDAREGTEEEDRE
ncbi:MAG: hypothetical protein ABEJ05_02765 [Haloglomus sp.]